MIKFVNILNNLLINYNFTIFGEKSFKFQFYYTIMRNLKPVKLPTSLHISSVFF